MCEPAGRETDLTVTAIGCVEAATAARPGVPFACRPTGPRAPAPAEAGALTIGTAGVRAEAVPGATFGAAPDLRAGAPADATGVARPGICGAGVVARWGVAAGAEATGALPATGRLAMVGV